MDSTQLRRSRYERTQSRHPTDRFSRGSRPGGLVLSEFVTAFRQRYDHIRSLTLDEQVRECVDYLQNPEILISEFVESYYQVEEKLDPEREDEALEASLSELVLEPFFDSLELHVRGRGGLETVRCVGGAFAPLPGELHPALEQQGLDYVGVRKGTSRTVLGVTDTSQESSVFSLLLRGLNCLAELSPPFQMTRLRRHVLKDRVTPDAAFDLQIGIFQRQHDESEVSLLMLTRDLAETFKARIEPEQQFSGTVGRIECLASGSNPPAPGAALQQLWIA